MYSTTYFIIKMIMKKKLKLYITVMKKKFNNSFHDKYLKKWSRNGITTFTLSDSCMVSFSC